MTIYDLSVISTTGFPYFTIQINKIPENVKIFLRFFDFSQGKPIDQANISSKFELTAGLISALFEFSRCIDKKIQLLEFKSGKEKDKENDSNYHMISNTLITCSSETYLIHNSIHEKIKLIYKNIISPKTPLETADKISKLEEKQIVDIITDKKACNHVLNNQKEILTLGEDFLNEFKGYGLRSISINSFDLSPIMVLGEKYSLKDIEFILRNIPEIPEISSMEWDFRQSFYKGENIWVYVVNSGVGITEENLFESYYYLLYTSLDSFLGETPGILRDKLNTILG